MNCPFCRKPMQEGFLHSTHRMFFSLQNRTHSVLIRPQEDDLVLTGKWTAGAVAAQFCPDCQQLVVSTQFSQDEKE